MEKTEKYQDLRLEAKRLCLAEMEIVSTFHPRSLSSNQKGCQEELGEDMIHKPQTGLTQQKCTA